MEMIYVTEKSIQFAKTEIPGFRTAPIWEENGERSYFAEFKAGTGFPLHGHEGIEQILLLSGRVQFGQVEMAPGDFMKVGADDEHDAYAHEDSLAFVTRRCGLVIKS
jgi:anti-sigma factor ChrR (cupin superfamily)